MSKHLREAGALGGTARALNMTDVERSDSARQAAQARAATLTKKQRSDIARKAAQARWKNWGSK